MNHQSSYSIKNHEKITQLKSDILYGLILAKKAINETLFYGLYMHTYNKFNKSNAWKKVTDQMPNGEISNDLNYKLAFKKYISTKFVKGESMYDFPLWNNREFAISISSTTFYYSLEEIDFAIDFNKIMACTTRDFVKHKILIIILIDTSIKLFLIDNINESLILKLLW